MKLSNLLAWNASVLTVLSLAAGAQFRLKLEQGEWSWGVLFNVIMVLAFAGLQVMQLSTRPRAGYEGPGGPPFLPSHRTILAAILLGLQGLAVVAGATLESFLDSPQWGQAVFALLGLAGVGAGVFGYTRLLRALPSAV